MCRNPRYSRHVAIRSEKRYSWSDRFHEAHIPAGQTHDRLADDVYYITVSFSDKGDDAMMRKIFLVESELFASVASP